MKVLKKVFDFYLNASIHVALGVYALSWITLKEFELLYDENVLYFIFFSTITAYNFIKYFGLAKFHHRSLANWLKVIQLFSLVCFVAMCYYAMQLERETWFYLLGFGAVTFLYAIPFLPKKIFVDKEQNLRSITGLKIYVIALVWAGVTVLLPLINSGYTFTFDVVITFFQRFIFTLVLTLPFDIRDMQYDSIRLGTIPQQIGLKRTKLVGVILMIVFYFLEYFKDQLAFSTIVLLVVTVITIVLLVNSTEKQHSYYSSFFVEAVPILWLLILLSFF